MLQNKLKLSKLNITLLIIFVISFLLRAYPLYTFGYPIGWLDAEVHTIRMTLMTRDPILFLKTLFGIETKPNVYPYNISEERFGTTAFWLANTSPPFIYVLGGIFSFFLKDVWVGYFTAIFLSSLGICVVFIFLYKYTKDYTVSLVTSLFLLFNAGEIWYWQQGAYTPLGGIFIYPLVILCIYEFLNNRMGIKLPIILLTLFLLSYPPFFLPLLFSLLFFVLYKRKLSKDLIKVIIIPLIITSFFLYRLFFGFVPTVAEADYKKGFVEAVMDVSGPPMGAMLSNPLPIYIMGAIGCIEALRRKKGEFIFYFSGILAAITFAWALVRFNINIAPLMWLGRLHEFIPQMTVIMTGYFLFFLKDILSSEGIIKSPNFKKYFVNLIMALIFIFVLYLNFNQLSFIVQRHGNLDDYKYETMLWVRKNTPEESTLLLFNPFQINGYDWVTFFYRPEHQLTVDELNALFVNRTISNSYSDYDYIVVNDYPIKTDKGSVSLNDVSKVIFENYTQVFSNKEVIILKK